MRASKLLGDRGKAFWKSITREIEITEPHDIELLNTACSCLDRIKEAQDQVTKDGPYQAIKGGGIRAHPGMKVEKEFLTLFYRAIKDLKLDPEPVKLIPNHRGRTH